MRPFTNVHIPEIPAVRVAYRVIRPGVHPSLRGVWWPRSRDLAVELPGLVAALDSRGFMVERVSFNQKSWFKAAHPLLIAGRIIRLGRFRLSDSSIVSLSGHDGRARIDLVVLPPGSRPVIAARAFARVLDWDNRTTVSHVPDGTPILQQAAHSRSTQLELTQV